MNARHRLRAPTDVGAIALLPARGMKGFFPACLLVACTLTLAIAPPAHATGPPVFDPFNNSHAFGNQDIVAGPTSSYGFTIENPNWQGSSLTFTSVTLTGTDPSQFQIASNSCTAVGQFLCDVYVKFHPLSTGAKSANLHFVDNATDSPQDLTLTGTGVAAAASVSPASHAFGSQDIAGGETLSQAFTVTNTGTDTLNVTSATLTGTDPSSFSITSNSCTYSVSPGYQCTVEVSFKPSTTGAKSAALSITDNVSGSPQNAPLTGTGTAAIATVSPGAYTFGSWNIANGVTSPHTFTVTNTGTATLSVYEDFVGGTNSSEFTVTSDSCNYSTLPPGTSCSVGVSFAPFYTGAKSAMLSFTDSASDSPQSAALTGTATGVDLPIMNFPTNYDFSNQVVGFGSYSADINVGDSGYASLGITSVALAGVDASQFEIILNTCTGATVAAQNLSSCDVSVVFYPLSLGAKSAGLNIYDNAQGSPQSVALTGIGTPSSTPYYLPPPIVAFRLPPPQITHLAVTPKAFTTAKNGGSIATMKKASGAAVGYDDSQAGTTTFTVTQSEQGVKNKNGACQKPTKSTNKRKRCTYTVILGTFAHSDVPGADHLQFTGRVRGQALKPSKYVLQAVAINAAGQHSSAVTAGFQVK